MPLWIVLGDEWVSQVANTTYKSICEAYEKATDNAEKILELDAHCST
jgi:hypothetical protein